VVFFYTANGTHVRGYVLDQNNTASSAWSQGVAGGRKVESVRVVHNPESFPDDPDENDEKDPGVLNDVAWIVYGGCEASGHMDILVHSYAKMGYVPAPYSVFKGIGVDQGYLWVFGSGAVACATHTSVMKCLKGKIAKPSWMVYLIPERLLYENDRAKNEIDPGYSKPLSGLIDLSPCDDGTLVASLDTREAIDAPYSSARQPRWAAFDRNHLYTMICHIDPQNRTLALKVSEGAKFGWVKIDGEAMRVHKQPIFCWPLIEGLIASLGKRVI
jgi:hypothetical protein